MNKRINKTFTTLMFVGFSFLFSAQIPNYVPSNGLVGWWPFNGNANDASGNGNNGTVNGAILIADRFAVANKAFGFNNLNDLISVTNCTPTFNNNAQTLSVWFKFNSQYTSSSLAILKNGTPYVNGFDLFIDQNNGAYGLNNYLVGLLLGNGASVTFISNQSELGQWANITTTYDGQSIKIYLNGILKGVSLFAGSINSPNNNIVIGQWDNLTPPNTFNRNIDDIGIWNRALTQQEITDLYQGLAAPQANITTPNASICPGQSTTITAAVANPGTPCANTGLPASLNNGLVGYWPFCGNANDASGNGNNGTVSGATLTADRFGAANSAYSFDGVNDYIQTLFNGISGSTSRTLNFWAQTTGANINPTTENMNVFNYGSSLTGGIWEVALNHGCEGLTLDIHNGVQTSNCNTNNNIWNHYTVVFDNSIGTNFNAVKFYQNGTLLSTTCQIGQLTNIYTVNANNAVIGAYWNSLLRFFNGKLDDIAIWNRALTQQEITQMYQQGQPTYSWSNGATTPSITVSPAQTTTYTCTISMNGATTTQSQTITVNPLPTVNAGPNLSVCTGASVTLSGSGASSYVWNNNVQNAVAFSPNATTTYTVVGTDANGCSNTAQTTVTVNALPTVTAPTNQTVCSGTNVTLTGGGASTYTWNNGVTNSVPFAANNTQTYTVTGTDMNGCSNVAQTTVTVNVLPAVTAAANQAVCAGTSVTISGSGALIYAWNNGVQNGVAFTPNVTTTYTVTGTDANGCTNTAQTTVTVNALPTVNAGGNQTVCAGSTATLNGSGAVSYAWNNNVQNGVSFVPNATQTYTVTGTDANGCQGTDQVLVTVASQTASSITQTACLSYELNAQVYNQSGVYTQTLVNAQGCDSILTLNLTINGLPSIPVVNVGGDNLLSTPAVPNTTYQWVYCPSGLSISNQNDTSYLPNVNGSYAVEASNSCGTVVSECVIIDNMGIEEVNNPLVIYPNPTPNVLYVQGISASETTYLLFNNQSKLLLEGNLTSIANAISLFELPSGLYHLYIGNHIFKIIKH